MRFPINQNLSVRPKPFLAFAVTSTDGKTIYIGELPTHFSYRGKQFDIDRYIVMHEVVEIPFEHQLHFSHEDAHQIALHAERAMVVSDGLR